MSEPGEASSLGLLTYCRNDIDGVLRNVRLLRPLVDEVVVVDSSSPRERTALSSELRGPKERMCLAPPLGNIDLLRPFGMSQMSSDRVFQIDSDEAPSPELLSQLRTLVDCEAYVVPRLEVGIGGFTHHMRLVRRENVEYRGPSYGFPVVRGRTRVLPRRLHILHRIPGPSQYWAEGDRRGRYLLADLLERPYDRHYFREAAGIGSRPRGSGLTWPRNGKNPPLSDSAVAFATLVEAGRTLVTTASPGIARMRLQQGRERIAFWNRLSLDEQTWVAATSKQVRESGGLVQYLGLDEPAYVERLNRAFDATVNGTGLFLFLLRVRSQTGHPWDGPDLPAHLESFALGRFSREARS